MNKTDQQQEILSRGERLFAKKSYQAAEKEFARALAMGAGGDLGKDIPEKIRICQEHMALDRRKDQIKKARRLENKKNLEGALACFTAASHILAEPWLTDKIAGLRRAMEKKQIEQAVEKADGEDPSSRLAAYELALAGGTDPVILEKKASALVEIGRYDEALALYTDESRPDFAPRSAQGRYDFGYALIQRTRYREGLSQWEPLLADYPALIPQITALLPYLGRELEDPGTGYALPRRVLNTLLETASVTEEDRRIIGAYQPHFDYCYLKELWKNGDLSAVRASLPSPPELKDAPLLARVYLGLAESEPDYLGPAITYWLTEIHRRSDPASPRWQETAAGGLDAETLRAGLLEPLAHQIDVHNQSGLMTPALKAHWEMERTQIARLAALLAKPAEEDAPGPPPGETGNPGGGGEEYLLCTPAFAREFGFQGRVLKWLQDNKDDLALEDGDLLELYAAYSPLGQHMAWIESGSEEKIFRALPPKTPDGKARDKAPANAGDRGREYLRQRIAFRCGMNRIRAGDARSRKYLQAAEPLLVANPRLRRELMDLAYGDSTSEETISSLSEAMVLLARRLDEPDFREATAYCVGIDVENLLIRGVVSLSAAEKRLAVGVELCPDSPRIQSASQFLLRKRTHQRIERAIRARNLPKAARIVAESGDSQIEQRFFDALENFYEQLAGAKEEEMFLGGLKELYECCNLVDEGHWLTEQIEEDLFERGAL